MKITIIFLLTFFGLTSNIFGFPTSPKSLRELVIESQYIIVGYVVNADEKKKYIDEWGSTVVRIAVLENLQGKINKDTIEIEYYPRTICPFIPIYFDSTYVISFIDKDEKSGRFYTNPFDFGAITLKKEEIEVYKQRIAEIQQILKISDKKKQRNETVEWLVKCAENDTTRWAGTYDLDPESNFMSYYSKTKKKDFKNVINTEQKERLKKALLNSNKKIDFVIVDIVYKGNETQIDELLYRKLKNLTEDEYWMADDFIDRLKHKNKSKEMNKVLKNYEKLRFEDDKKDELKKIIEKFIKLIDK